MDWENGIVPLQGCLQSRVVDFTKQLDMSNLKGKVILITGGASGFGAAVAHTAASHGAHLMIADINTALGEQMISDLRLTTSNQNHHFFPCNVADWSSQASFFKGASLASPHGGIDVVIANAGITGANESALFESPPDYSRMSNPPEPQITRTLDINLRAVFFTSHLALSYLPKNPGSSSCSTTTGSSPPPPSQQRDRHLILISSMAGLTPVPGLASYTASKHGVVGLFRSLRMTAPQTHGVRVNMINPYFAPTALLGLAGQLLMAGAEMAQVSSVVDAVIRLMADDEVVGRGVVVAPSATEGEAEKVQLEHGGCAWDVYAEDFAMTDVFVRRVVAVTNFKVRAKGWAGVVADVVRALGRAGRRLVRW